MNNDFYARLPASGPVRPTALIIDDSMLFRRSIARSLEAEGLRIAGTAEGGVLGAELAINLRPALIILDHHMPDLNGAECLKIIREAEVRSRIIVCSAELTLESSQEYALLGAYAIFIKPIPLNAFRRVVRSAVDLSAGNSEGGSQSASAAG